MSKSALMSVGFHGDTLSLINLDNKAHFAVKPVCDAIGLTWQGQLERIKRNPVLNSVISVTLTTGSDGKSYEMICLPLSMLNGWLFGINANRVKNPEIRQKLIQYQFECYDVLNNYWNGKPVQRAALPVAPVASTAPAAIATPRFRAVKFYEDTLYLAPFEGRPYTTLEHIVRGIGLDWPEQHECILHDRRVREHLHVLHLETENGRSYGGICLPLNALAFWLFRISSDKVADPEVKRRLRTYRYECRESLIYYWNNPPAGDAAKAAITWVKPAATPPVLCHSPEINHNPVFRFPFEHYIIRGVRRERVLWFVAEDLRIVFGYSASRGLMTKGIGGANISSALVDGRREQLINGEGLFRIVGKRHRAGRSPGAIRAWLSQVVMPAVLAGNTPSVLPEKTALRGFNSDLVSRDSSPVRVTFSGDLQVVTR